jgi:hypothetical protein
MIPTEWAGPYWTSNAAALLLLGISWRWPNAARFVFAAMFLGAAFVNARLALARPAEYLEYAKFAILPGYREFILGWFADHAQGVVMSIAGGQALCGALMLSRKTVWLGAIGQAIFLLAIAPLGVGSAFPFSLTCVAGLWLVARDAARDDEDAWYPVRPSRDRWWSIRRFPRGRHTGSGAPWSRR